MLESLKRWPWCCVLFVRRAPTFYMNIWNLCVPIKLKWFFFLLSKTDQGERETWSHQRRGLGSGLMAESQEGYCKCTDSLEQHISEMPFSHLMHQREQAVTWNIWNILLCEEHFFHYFFFNPIWTWGPPSLWPLISEGMFWHTKLKRRFIPLKHTFILIHKAVRDEVYQSLLA